MSKAEIVNELLRFVARESNIADLSLIGEDVDLINEGILDSLMAAVLISFCQERFGCDLSDRDFSEDDMRTIGGLADVIAGRVKQQELPGTGPRFLAAEQKK
jgi:acyl carrier protein